MKVREKLDKISISSAVSVDRDLYFSIKDGNMNKDEIVSFLDQILSEVPVPKPLLRTRKLQGQSSNLKM